ncbi:MAG TPA: YdeI/OmpD-associated family protein [Acidimicrobiia bacterium]|nr:YdeI/OmpD-associated family protein [Acidimicrobiia bacterium]
MPNVADLDLPDSPNGKDVLVPASRGEWRDWLSANADRPDGLWLVYRNKSSVVDGPLYHELVEEALCFGWIDSVTKRVDDDRRIQWFSPRRKGGIWSALNKERIQRLTAEGLMDERGRRVIEEAMADGSWSQYDDVEALVIHEDLSEALDRSPGARDAWEATSPSMRKQYLWQVYSAKREETRAKRIESIIQELSSGD